MKIPNDAIEQLKNIEWPFEAGDEVWYFYSEDGHPCLKSGKLLGFEVEFKIIDGMYIHGKPPVKHYFIRGTTVTREKVVYESRKAALDAVGGYVP